ncbi:MAG: ATP-binding protein [Cellvibrionaceae bacterium]|nr:ATP-binding protein [Cellvibrionaceae bacterium]MCV6627702.1 ATP-binding protein [Cellvibrionaceae bacterium]
MKLRTKLFIAFICATASVTLAVAAWVNHSFDRGFRDYLNQMALQRAAPVVATMQDYYQRHGSWDELRNNHRRWRRLLLFSIAQDRGLGDAVSFDARREFEARDRDWRDRDEDNRRHRPPKKRVTDLGWLRLYDRDEDFVVGPKRWPRECLKRPIEVDGEVVGYIGVRPISIHTDRIGTQFRNQQLKSLAAVVLVVIAVSALLAWVLARHLTGPIAALTRAANQLAAGDYQTRVSVRGKDELATLAEDFNQLALALERNEKSRQQWIADISHELRTPLAVLRGEIEAVMDGVRRLDESRVQSLHGEILALSQLVDDLYQLALSDVGALDYRFEAQPVSDVLGLSIDAFSDRFNKAGLRFETEGLDRLSGTMRADSNRLAQLFNNLFENSIRYTDSGGRVKLSASQSEQSLELRLEDSAPGVAAADLEKIFERLYRVDQSRSREHGGSGLGLALCRNIVEAHGGEIRAEASALGGVAIIIQLPRVGG